MRRLPSVLSLTAALLIATSLPTLPPVAPVAAQAALSGRVLGSARGQVAWLDLLAPRPTPLTQLVRPAYPADVAAAPGVPFAVASVVSAFPPGSQGNPIGGDLTLIDLESSSSRTLLARAWEGESLDVPALWPDGSGILYQRSNLHAAISMPGQAQPQFVSRVEQIGPDGQGVTPLLEDARYPGPAPDGTRFAFIRSSPAGVGIFVHSLVDGSDTQLVPPGKFLALAYPRFSPDGLQVAFVAIALAAPIGEQRPAMLSWLAPAAALAHGFPWEAWIVNSDGSNMHQVEDVVDDDPSVCWSPDGSELLIYGGWGSYVVEAASGATTSLTYVAGYGSIGWLPD